MARISLSIGLILLGCGGGGSTDIDGTLRFSDRSDLEISRLVSAASGSEGFQAQATAESYADPFEPGDPCPARSFAGDTGTITGGCTTMDGVAIEGTIALNNPLNWCLVFDTAASWCDMTYEGNYNAESSYTFSGFALTQSGFRRSFDGRFTVGSLYETIDMDLVSVQLDVAVRSDIHVEYSGGRNATIDGSGVELVGVGGARVSGEVNVSTQTNQTSGSFTLDGADTVQVTLANNCVTWRIEGSQRMFSTCP
jgi:hypothetical protein